MVTVKFVKIVAKIVALALCLWLLKSCMTPKIAEIDCTSQEVQSVLADVNFGIGEGTYDKAFIFPGKDHLLAASCVISPDDWNLIAGKYERVEHVPRMVGIGFVHENKIQRPLGCYRTGLIVFCGFATENADVYLLVDNIECFPDVFGKS